jgi:hypothetical protein
MKVGFLLFSLQVCFVTIADCACLMVSQPTQCVLVIVSVCDVKGTVSTTTFFSFFSMISAVWRLVSHQ